MKSSLQPTVPRSSEEKIPERIFQTPPRPFVPAVREPYALPEQQVILPPPPPAPGKPPTFNWLGSLLPPAIIILVMLIYSRVSPNAGNFVYPSMLTSLAFPLANLGNLYFQRRNYHKQLEKRRLDYQKILAQEKLRIDGWSDEQRRTLYQEYPSPQELMTIAMSQGKKRRLWWRRPKDGDFLSLRIGLAKGAPSFRLSFPNLSDPYDPLKDLPNQLITTFEKISDLPFLIDLKGIGSLGIVSKDEESLYGMVRRLMLDVCVHHSPSDLQIALICDSSQGVKGWDWMKWIPHSRTLQPGRNVRTVAFTMEAVDECVQWVVSTYKLRVASKNSSTDTGMDATSILAIFDDHGSVRQNPALLNLIEDGHTYGIYTIFLGERNLPRIHARLDVSQKGSFLFMETWERGQKTRGKVEMLGASEITLSARALAKLELLGAKLTFSLPENIRLSQLLKEHILSEDAITHHWQKTEVHSDRELLQFPIGVQVTREGLETLNINLLPADKGGEDAYHTILIGTTGSGKSEFMKSLVLAAAHKYSPREISFFFMDFKAGAAFNPFAGLPHVSGVVTNLMKPELVKRGLVALQGEITRRQGLFHSEDVQNIWDYNQTNSSPLPHLVLLLDEFTKGLNDFPELRDMLDLLVRQGRSLGMYLILANQDVNASVDKLLNNVGWRIALKVAQQSEMHIIERTLQPTRRAGRGYLRSSNGEITEFQAAYSGQIAFTETTQNTQEYKIIEISPEGVFKDLFVNSPLQTSPSNLPSIREEEVLINLFKQVAHEPELAPVHQIYLSPLPEHLYLDRLLEQTDCHRRFISGDWVKTDPITHRLKVPVGFIDLPELHLQKPLWVDFSSRDGHLWIAGVPNSGKAVSLATILFSLASTHTPQEVQFYILEFGSGSLRDLENLPHVGAVIQLHEKERFNRLFKFIEEEIAERKSNRFNYSDFQDDQNSFLFQKPEIFLIINNFAALREKYSEKIEQVSAIAQDGNAIGFHLILTTNRGNDLPPKLSNNIARRIVLEMPNRDEYFDLIKQKVPSLSGRAKGRGYWVDDMVAECQIAQTHIKENEIVNQKIVEKMREAWEEPAVPKIQILEKLIPLSRFLSKTTQSSSDGALNIPAGVDYENLNIATLDLQAEIRQWTILGPKHSGKSNFLMGVACSFMKIDRANWDLLVLAFRPSPLQKLPNHMPAVNICSTVNEIEDACKQLEERLRKDRGKRLLWLVDDLGAVFEPGRENIAALINNIGNQLTVRDDVTLLATVTLDEVRTRKTNNALVKLLAQTQTGLSFATDYNMLEWLGVAPNKVSEYLKMDLPAGRGFFVRKGNPVFLQTPIVDLSL